MKCCALTFRRLSGSVSLDSARVARVTARIIGKCYVGPSMRRDVSTWCKNCIPCQLSKVSRHNHVSPAHFTAPDGRFKHVHIDLIGPLPVSNGYKYYLTMIDRFSRWPEAVPLRRDIEASTICRAFFDHWVSRYGSPETLTTCCYHYATGSCALFSRLMKIFPSFKHFTIF